MRRSTRFAWIPLGLLLGLLALVRAEPGSAPLPKANSGPLKYNRDVRPILAENCFACHGPDSAARKAGLRLDQREDAIKAKAIAPGKPEKSRLIDRINRPKDDEELMPPKGSHKELTKAQKEVLKKWIEEGAEYELHWSFLAPKKPAPPKFDDAAGKAWVRNPIDAFILAELRKRGLEPAPEADRRTLARRVALDLTGLPPEPAAVDAFVNDTTADAYEKYVDQLLASNDWGEQRGRYWLDYARFADTHGIHFDNYRENWAYRDWVINAFNSNMKFDQFTTEQLAGDLLPNATLEQKIATGFNRSHITTNEGGAINEEYLVLYTRDRTETASQVFLGLTAGCAVCHDHKFDPFSAKDFYGLSAFFNNSTQQAMDGNIPDTPPILFVPAKEDRAKYTEWQDRLNFASAKLAERKKVARTEFTTELSKLKLESIAAPEAGLQFLAEFQEGKGDTAKVKIGSKVETLVLPNGIYDWRDGPYGTESKVLGIKPGKDGATLSFPPSVGDFENNKPFSVAAWVQVPTRGQTGAILGKMDDFKNYRGWDLYLQNDRFAAHFISSWAADGIKITGRNSIDPNKWHHVAISWDGTQTSNGFKLYVNGELQPVDVLKGEPARDKDIPSKSTKTSMPLTVGRRTPGSVLKGVGLSELRMYDRALDAKEMGELAVGGKLRSLLAKPVEKRKSNEIDELFNWWLATRDEVAQQLTKQIATLKADEAGFKTRGTTAPVSSEKTTPPEAFILKRGDYDKRGEKVSADTPKALPPLEKDLPRNRLGLAKWLLSPDNPLTSRVTVNRFWQEIFGQGLVRTSGDFGVAGEMPSHPELLDWMAEEFESYWDIKRFFKLIVTSSTYRQSAAMTAVKREKDPSNIYLSRGPRYRMDAEMIRDYALAASGLLVKKIGGPSVKPYQPEGVWEAVAMPGSNTRDYKRDTGEALYRKGMYTFWKRAAPPAAMEVMNAPNRETCAVRRERTNTPLQALLTLNDIQFIEAARVLAEKVIRSGEVDDARLDFLAKRLLARSFTSKELPIIKASLAELQAEYKSKPEAAKKLLTVGDYKADAKLNPSEVAAWAMLCNQLFNLDEVLTK